ncbi:WG repeat-containing protein [Acetanaerobacterium elongatum]|uniref:Uncharacterized Zn-finger containing protein, UPF0148 family n=1 Tax=Acetanaerobacterium elongatum TaxID=258515 RepID=A0A1G9UQ95_9FIRM|nr:WG repeat-containing protein [Acetanaerobacterium elongatum]SDM62027.1 Uncharacterized Zn-finger containing protein, UPF0148 family [Acetanaerobacterium elongatum]
MKHCESCGASLHKKDLFCPKCGAKQVLEETASPALGKQIVNDVIHISDEDVVLIMSDGERPYEVKTEEELAEEERAYQEDREPIYAAASKTEAAAQNEPPVVKSKARSKWGSFYRVIKSAPAEASELREHRQSLLGIFVASAAVLAILAAAVTGWAYLSTDSFMLQAAVKAAQAGNYESAIASLERLTVKDGENPEVYYQLCLCYRASKQDGKALVTAQLGYDSTKDERLSALVTELTGSSAGKTSGVGQAQQPQNSAGAFTPEESDTRPALPSAQLPKVAPVKIQMIIEPAYEAADQFVDGLARVKLNGKWGFINKTNTLVVPAQYDETQYFREELAAVKTGGKWGYIDKTGAVRIAPQYSNTLGFSEGFAASLLNGKWGFIDATGKMGLQYEAAESFSGGLAAVETGKTFGFVNSKGEMVVPAIYQKVLPFAEGAAAVLLDGKWGYIDTVGRTIILPQYEEAYSFQNGVARVKSGGKYGYINRMGWQLTPFEYDQAWGFSEGLATVRVGKLYGYVNLNGEMVIEPTLEDISSFSQGLLPYKQGDVWGYLNADEQIAIQPQFAEAGRFYGGLAKVKNDEGLCGYINLAGETVCAPEYEDGGVLTDGLIPVKKNGLWGYLAVTQS